MKSQSKRIITHFLIGFCISATLTSCSDSKPETAAIDEQPCLSADEMQNLVSASLKPVSYEISLNGKVDYNPNNVLQYVSLVDGVLTNTFVSLGDKVEKGQVLATIKSTELNAMQANLQQLQAQLKVAQRELQSTESFYKNGISSEKDLIMSQSEVTQIESQIDNLKTNLELFSAKPEAGVFEIKAPVSGYIVANHMASGLQINAGSEPLFTLSNLDEVWINANVYAKDIPYVKEGMEVTIGGNAFADTTFKGEINNISQVIDPDENVVKARIILKNSDLSLKPGLNVTVIAHRELNNKAVWLPKKAVIFNNDSYHVIVAKDGDQCHMEVRNVTIGHQDKNGYFIDGGLEAGEKIVDHDAILWYNAYASK
ncbi:efflux RND transporter periplasmic adaptor subunit [Fulvivirga maritima]|uniref:efflux RND transporter periplasmic adaptor subunit n=1 Tax=Fulvivirga maritima TaxID=2904247 RepID=UPI001F45E213|nr:efflux RND transporter periplasmic adaptor subunit [Fulvivirga maritima]UII25537.1 efflux RND transporter periplasmic adaptor subunit [Fulvivirga maritima]